MTRMQIRSGLLIAVLFFLAAGILAQSTTGRLTGAVRDASDALIPGAQVLVKNEQTGAEFDVITNDVGAWTVPSVQNGTYTITITLPGFKSAVFQKVKVDTGTTATVNARLEIGEVAESVTILGGSSVIQTESANVSSTIVGRHRLRGRGAFPILPTLR